MKISHTTRTFYLLISPWSVMFFFLNVFPMLYSFYLSLTRFDGISAPRFTGLKNYTQLLTDYRFLSSLYNTLRFTFLNVVFSLIAGFLIAYLLNRDIKAKRLLRSIFFIPYAVPVIATVFIWKTILNRESGLINIIIDLFNPNLTQNLLVDHPTLSLITMFVWQCGGSMVVFLAGLQGIPKELLEAADIDGANTVFILKNITLPLMSPIILYQTVVGIMLSFSVIVQPILLTSSPGAAFTAFLNQQPPFQNYFTIIYAFQQCFTNQSFGYGMAVVWLMFIVILVVTFIFLKVSNKLVYYEYEQ
ncbi:MAG: sugar ABC transporter permease [Spirochaetota bacterium]